jgi:hypothetical protein
VKPITVFLDPDQQFWGSRSGVFFHSDHFLGMAKKPDREDKIPGAGRGGAG